MNLVPDFAMVFGPPLLFPIARHSETQWSVELWSEWGAGGAVFSHDDDMRVEYGSLAELIDVYAEPVERGRRATRPRQRSRKSSGMRSRGPRRLRALFYEGLAQRRLAATATDLRPLL